MGTIMLDVDGVLVGGRPQDGAPYFTDLERDLGVSVERLRHEFFASRWPAIITGQKELIPELAEVLAVIAPSVTAEGLVEYWFLNDSRIDLAVLEAVPLLRARGHRVFLATNQEHLRADYLMNDMGLASEVDGIFYSAAIGHRKPAQGFFARVTEIVAVAPSSITLIDDTEENVSAAQAYGWNAVHWKHGMAVMEELMVFGP